MNNKIEIVSNYSFINCFLSINKTNYFCLLIKVSSMNMEKDKVSMDVGLRLVNAINSMRVLHSSLNCWSVTASLLGSLELFSVFQPILVMLLSGWFPWFLWFPIPPNSFSNLRGLFQIHLLQLISPSFSCSTVFCCFF